MKTKKILTLILILYIILSSILSISYATEIIENNNSSNTSGNTTGETTNTVESDTIYQVVEGNELTIASEAATLIDSRTGTILYSKNGDEKLYPASTTKILTAILVIENGNLEDVATASQEAVDIPEGYSSADLLEGEEMAVDDLLKALLLHSANDAANVLAEYISGSIDAFVELMNQKAIELGCTNTNFTNTNGVHDENHYSTSNDIAIISQYCMQNEIFKNIVSMTSCTIPATNMSEEREFINTNDMLIETSEYYREDCIGVKTGYTTPAKNCLVAASSQDDTELICVTLGSSTLDDRYDDTNTLFDYGYEIYPTFEMQIAEAEQSTSETEYISPISTENLFSQSYWDYFIRSEILITILRIFLIIIILIIVALIIHKKHK